MGSDRARVSYDEKKRYRRVVHQQGRVVLEADLNEAQEILTEETRGEARDIVGPFGVPSSNPLPNVGGTGYAVEPAQNGFDFIVSAGVIYVGGLRVVLDKPVHYSKQPDWLDGPKPRENRPGRELVYLELEEQEVSAVEDHRLREQALGGPDTAQRLRVVQRFARTSVAPDSSCKAAAQQAFGAWQKEGRTWEAHTMRLVSNSKLKVSYTRPTTPPNVCEPEAQSGYLGDENQLVRVQISPNEGKILWAYDGASALYRAEVQDDGRTVKITPAPVDAFHHPRTGQYAEVLLPRVDLGPNAADGSHDFAAAPTGFVVPIKGSYDVDSGTIQLDTQIPLPVLKQLEAINARWNEQWKSKAPLFLRIWEQEMEIVGSTKELVDSSGQGIGLQVTLLPPPFVPGDYWLIALRPSLPTSVDPPRHLLEPQPPDGPRRWACPLAAVTWSREGRLERVELCPPPFDDLVTLTKKIASVGRQGGCCTVVVGPGDVRGDLQRIVDDQLATVQGGRVTICLLPGEYALRRPLLLDSRHSHLTIEGCADDVVIRAERGSEREFPDGLVVLIGANGVTLHRLHFIPPLVPFIPPPEPPTAAGRMFAGIAREQFNEAQAEWLERLIVSIAVRPMNCEDLTIRECFFHHTPANTRVLFAAGIFAAGAIRGLTIEGNRFLSEPAVEPPEDVLLLVFGYLHAPSTTLRLRVSGSLDIDNVTERAVLLPRLDRASIADNLFSSLTAAVMIEADTESLRLERNRALSGYAGFWLYRSAFLVHGGTLYDPLLKHGLTIAHAYPTPEELQTTEFIDNGNQRSIAGHEEFFRRMNITLPPRTPTAGESAADSLLVPLHALLILIEYQHEAAHAHAHRATLLVSGNELDVKGLGADSGVALAVVDAVDPDDPGSIARIEEGSTLVSSNRLRNNSQQFPTAALVLVERCTITGNLAFNDRSPPPTHAAHSIIVKATFLRPNRNPEAVAVTGNVFQGKMALPSRPLQPPLNTWDVFNATL